LLKLIDVNARVLPTVVHVISEDVVQIGACDWRREKGEGDIMGRRQGEIYIYHTLLQL
jgi:hypothetical protein